MNELNDCIFCKIIRGELPCTKVFEDENTFAFLSTNPVSAGHTLVIPKQHCRNIFDASPEILACTIKTVQKIAKKYPCAQIVQNNEKPLQEVFHLHFHIIPYRDGKNDR
jgi:histidine triad (HIT) family protein